MSFEKNEKSSFCLAVELLDRHGKPLSPIDSVSWWVGKPKSDTPVYPKHQVAEPLSSFEIIVPAEANICSGSKNESKFLIVRVQSGPHVEHKAFEYTVIALNTVPYPDGE